MNLLGIPCEGLVRLAAMSGWVALLSKATLLLAVVWLVHFALARANPRWRVLLWRGSAVGIMLLAVCSLGMPGFEVRVEAPAATMPTTADRPVAAERVPVVDEFASVEPIAVPIYVEPAPIDRPTPLEVRPESVRSVESPVRSVSPVRPVSWQAVLIGIWGFVVALLVVRLVIGHLRLAGLLRDARPAPEAVAAEVRRISTALGYRREVRVFSSRQFATPFLHGQRRPAIVFPERMCRPDNRLQLSGIIAHELAHVRSGDFGWNAVLQVASILLWFHPLAWQIASAHRAACDAVCDAVSASLFGDVQAYCRVLARVALEGAGSFPATGLAMARSCDVRRRIAALDRKVFVTPLKRRAVVGAALAGLLSLSLLAAVRLALAEPPVPNSTQTNGAGENIDKNTAGQAGSGTQIIERKAAEPKMRTMRIQVLDAKGKPLENSHITVRIMTSLPFGPTRYQTDKNGDATVRMPAENVMSLQILVTKGHYVTTGAIWYANGRGGLALQLPDEYTFRLERSTILGGTILDEDGKPVAGTTVRVNGRKTIPNGPLWISISDKAKTDAEGRWQVDRIPKDLSGFVGLRLTVKRPDVIGVEGFDLEKLPVGKLRARSAEIVLQKGITIEGTVTDPQGKPAVGADVGLMARQYSTEYPRTKTDDQGRFRFAVYEPGEYVVATAAEGFAPDTKTIAVDKKPLTVNLQLRKGERIRLRVVGGRGRPMPGANVSTVFGGKYFDALRFDYESAVRRNLKTDAEGRWSKLWIPEDALRLHISKPGCVRVIAKYAPGEREHVVTLMPGGWSVAGRVVDRETKRPVTKFRVVEGSVIGSGGIIWRKGQLVENPDGRYRAAWDFPGRAIRIEADGYFPSSPRRLKADQLQVTYDVELERGGPIVGTVYSADGRPLADAEVALCTATRGLSLRNGRPMSGQPQLIVRTGADGRFSFPPRHDLYLLIAMHEDGFARIENKADMKKITLQPWATVKGTLLIDGKPRAGESITIDYGEYPPGGRIPLQEELEKLSPIERTIKMIELRNTPLDRIPKETLDQIPRETLDRIKEKRRRAAVSRRVHYDYRAKTDAQGRFVFERVVPGMPQLKHTIELAREGGMSSWTAARSVPIKVSAGQTVRRNIGGSGRAVVGRIAFAEGDRRPFDFSGQSIGAERLLPDIPWPEKLKHIPEYFPFRSEEQKRRFASEAAKRGMPMPKRSEEDIRSQWWHKRNQWQRQWLESDAGKAYRGNRETNFAARVGRDGSFRFDDLPPGEYILRTSIFSRKSMSDSPPGNFVGSLRTNFNISAMPEGRNDKPLNLGVLPLKVRKRR